MFNMYPMAGMGSNGLGIAGPGLGGPQMPQMPQGMPQMPGGMSPMSALMSAALAHGGAGGNMAPSMPAGTGQPPAAQQGGIASMLGTPNGLQQLLAALKAGQNGLPAQNQTPGVGDNQVAPGLPGGMAPGLDMFLRNLGMFGGMTGGAPT